MGNTKSKENDSKEKEDKDEKESRRLLLSSIDGDNNDGNSLSEGTGNLVINGDHNIINYNTGNSGGSGSMPCFCKDGSVGHRNPRRAGRPSVNTGSGRNAQRPTPNWNTEPGKPGKPSGRISRDWENDNSGDWFPYFKGSKCTNYGHRYCPTSAPTTTAPTTTTTSTTTSTTIGWIAKRLGIHVAGASLPSQITSTQQPTKSISKSILDPV